MPQWIAGITRGHNAGICLLKDGEIVFAIEEERLSRQKYDGGPLAAMLKILDYTDKLDYLVVAHTQPLSQGPAIDFTGDNLYSGFARKLGLIDRKQNLLDHPQVIDYSFVHHKLHASCAFYRSGFESATAVIVDGAGSFIPMNFGSDSEMTWELESYFTCEYPANFKTIYKHLGGRGPWLGAKMQVSSSREGEEGEHQMIIDDTGGIVKGYEAVTQYCGWAPIEAGKTMGLAPYGKPNDQIPPIYTDGGASGEWRSTNRNLIIPTFPNGAAVAETRFAELNTPDGHIEDLTKLQNRRDLAYAVQAESQQEVLDLIIDAVKKTGNKNVVLSGGYGLNCVANYWYLDKLKEHDIKLYVEPISSDAGTAIGAALLQYHLVEQDDYVRDYGNSLYLGPKYTYSEAEVDELVEKYDGVSKSTSKEEIANLIAQKNIVTIFQGGSESGPRALGNRSILFDPTYEDGKDFVNQVKRREYFRPFAGSILHEHAHEWFDMKGLEESPHMMYAMNCQPGVEEKIPSIIHVDGTCRIQTVKREQNPHYYDLINEFYKLKDVPIVFNTSFNLGGEPLVETLDDAMRTLVHSDIEYLYLPELEKLIKIENE